ncbi:hypothetical protein PUN28_007702 [Cardiocondyla obscurior]|uniref:Uncharacterized protein n=1 Tax=Cardiocondyla obscurior TaxID=286306 RepID=A0AAW2FTQ5_9HYME
MLGFCKIYKNISFHIFYIILLYLIKRSSLFKIIRVISTRKPAACNVATGELNGLWTARETKVKQPDDVGNRGRKWHVVKTHGYRETERNKISTSNISSPMRSPPFL